MAQHDAAQSATTVGVLPLDVRTRIAAGINVVVALLPLAAVPLKLLVPGSTSLALSTIATITSSLGLLNLALVLLPWRRRLSAAAQELVLLVIVAAGATAVLVGVFLSAQDDTLGLVYLPLTALISGLLLPVRRHVAVLAITCTVALVGAAVDQIVDGAVWAIVATLALAGLVAAGMAQYVHAITLARDAARSADDATAALRAVVDAARASAATDAGDVLTAVARAAVAIGSDEAAVYVDEGGSLRRGAVAYRRPQHPSQVDDEPSPGTRPVLAAALARSSTVVIPPHDVPQATSSVAIAVPFGAEDAPTGVLHAMRMSGEPFPPSAVHAVELLAGHAERALAVTRRIDDDRQTLDALRELNERQSTFVTTASHELRTPVAIVDGLATTLIEHGDVLGEERRRDLLQRLAANSTSLVQVVTSLLDTAVLDRGLVLAAEPVVLSDLVPRSVKRLEPMATGHRLDVLADEDVVVSGDGPLIERVVENLVTNALRHTPTGTCVTVTVRRVDDSGMVMVSDDGPGIDAELLPMITERFIRGNRRTRGLGIGLSLVSEVLRAHGTHLEVASTAGEGARFGFTLPLSSVH